MLNTDRVREAASGCTHTCMHALTHTFMRPRILSVKVSDVAHWHTRVCTQTQLHVHSPVTEGTDMFRALNIKGCNFNG